jgi:hypothetical protein
VEIVDADTHLLEMVLALHSPCGFTSGLNGRQQESDQNADDRNNNKKFNERKRKKITSLTPPPPS